MFALTWYLRHFQQYFRYIVAETGVHRENHRPDASY
jgi:hypothetical protein